MDWVSIPTGLPAGFVVGIFAIMSIFLGISGRLLTKRSRIDVIPSDAVSVTKYVDDNKLFDRASKMDFYHYTAETIVTPWRGKFKKHSRPLEIRILVRRPEVDSGKHQVAEGSLDTVNEICRENPNIDIDVRFYQHEPLSRLQFYIEPKVVTCLIGVYRYEQSHPMHFVGAEDNAMMILSNRWNRERSVIEAYQSRFEYQWDQCSPLRSVIFDMDGVLINSMKYHFQSWKKAFENAGISVEEEKFRKMVYELEGLDARQSVRTLCDRHLDKGVIDQIANDKNKIYLSLSSEAKPFADVCLLLDYLNSREVPLAVVTGTPREAAEGMMERHFRGRFKELIAGEDIKSGKPAPTPFLEALKRLNIKSNNQCLIVENAPLGVQAAAAAKIPVYGILMDSPLDSTDLTKKGAVRVFASHRDLLDSIMKSRFCRINS